MFEDINVLLLELEGKDKINAEQCDRLFNLHNQLFPDLKEWNRSCPACRERIYNRMREWWMAQKQ
jgi:hypothetical protein